MAYGSSGGKHKARFMECMAPNELRGAGIKSTDQVGRRAIQELKKPYPIGTTPQPAVSWEEYSKRYDAAGRVEKRKNRGGSIFRPGDGISRGII